jgi:hypothetical protein
MISGFCDAEWANDSNGGKSQGGYAFFLNNAAISWSSKKQTLVALSTSEGEYVACSEAAREAQWLLQLTKDIDNLRQSEPMEIFTDSEGALSTVNCEPAPSA